MKKPGNRNKAREKAPIKKNYNNIKEYKVTKECELLEFLLETFKNQSRNSVKSLLSSHRVSIDSNYIQKIQLLFLILQSKRKREVNYQSSMKMTILS